MLQPLPSPALQPQVSLMAPAAGGQYLSVPPGSPAVSAVAPSASGYALGPQSFQPQVVQQPAAASAWQQPYGLTVSPSASPSPYLGAVDASAALMPPASPTVMPAASHIFPETIPGAADPWPQPSTTAVAQGLPPQASIALDGGQGLIGAQPFGQQPGTVLSPGFMPARNSAQGQALLHASTLPHQQQVQPAYGGAFGGVNPDSTSGMTAMLLERCKMQEQYIQILAMRQQLLQKELKNPQRYNNHWTSYNPRDARAGSGVPLCDGCRGTYGQPPCLKCGNTLNTEEYNKSIGLWGQAFGGTTRAPSQMTYGHGMHPGSRRGMS